VACIAPAPEDGVPPPLGRLGRDAAAHGRAMAGPAPGRRVPGLARSRRADRVTRRIPEQLRLLIEGWPASARPFAAHVPRTVIDAWRSSGWTTSSLLSRTLTRLSRSSSSLALELEGKRPVEGRWVERVIGIDDVRQDIAKLRTPDGHGRIELASVLR
jgi:hypothetical protein